MPAEYVNKLARMFQDMQVSEDLNTEFKELTKNNSESLPSAGKECHCLESFMPRISSSFCKTQLLCLMYGTCGCCHQMWHVPTIMQTLSINNLHHID